VILTAEREGACITLHHLLHHLHQGLHQVKPQVSNPAPSSRRTMVREDSGRVTVAACRV